MKKSLVMFCIAPLVARVVVAQSFDLVRTTSFDFEGLRDAPVGLTSDPAGNVIVNGFEEANGFIGSVQFAALAKFDSVSRPLWALHDSAGSFSGFAATALIGEDIYWAVHHNAPADTSSLLLKVNGDGVVLWKKTVPFASFAIVAHGDGLVALSDTSVVMLDSSGHVLGGFPFSSDTEDGNLTAKILGDSLWIFGMFRPPTSVYTSGFAELVDLQKDSVIWRVNIDSTVRCFGDVDSSGNAYIVASRITASASGRQEFLLVKVSPAGATIWQQSWFGHMNYVANDENWANGVTVSDRSRFVIAYGSVQKGELYHTTNQYAYFVAFDLRSGEQLYTSSFEFDQRAFTNQVNGGCFDNDGNLVLLGQTYSGGSASAPNEGYLRTFTIVPLSAVPESSPLAAPGDFHLFQNSPNPFNPSTTIRFSVPVASRIRLTIFNLLGQRIAELADETVPAGEYRKVWSAQCASGLYMYRFEAVSLVEPGRRFIESRKMILLR